MRAQRQGEAGQTLVMFALLLALVLVFLLALVIDVAAVVRAYERDAIEATLAAQAGATAVDQDAYYQTGARQLVPSRAQTLCRSVADGTSGVDCDVSGDTITVTVQGPVALPIGLFGAAVPITVTRQATGVFGGVTPEGAGGGG